MRPRPNARSSHEASAETAPREDTARETAAEQGDIQGSHLVRHPSALSKICYLRAADPKKTVQVMRLYANDGMTGNGHWLHYKIQPSQNLQPFDIGDPEAGMTPSSIVSKDDSHGTKDETKGSQWGFRRFFTPNRQSKIRTRTSATSASRTTNIEITIYPGNNDRPMVNKSLERILKPFRVPGRWHTRC